MPSGRRDSLISKSDLDGGHNLTACLLAETASGYANETHFRTRAVLLPAWYGVGMPAAYILITIAYPENIVRLP